MPAAPWSIATAIRNPDRLRGLLFVLQQMEGQPWNYENQEKYQILLIQNRLYGYGNSQFYNGLSDSDVELIDDTSREIKYHKARQIFLAKGYEDPPMRGRQSFNPLKKMGVATIEQSNIKVTDLGRLLLLDSYDSGEVLFRSLLKWQITRSAQQYTYNINPFIATLHLINAVNQIELNRGNQPKGISRDEFNLFVPTLINYREINQHAETIIAFRDKLSRTPRKKTSAFLQSYSRKYAKEFLRTKNDRMIAKLLNNLKDYGDNTIRYFRLTRYIYIRGNGYYIDLEPRRNIEIQSLLSSYDGSAIQFETNADYNTYMSDIAQPVLPWETKDKQIEIIHDMVSQITTLGGTITLRNLELMTAVKLKEYVKELRQLRQELQDNKLHEEMQDVSNIERYIDMLNNIEHQSERPILLEKLSALGLRALNDAIKIQPNYPVGDDNEPTFTAPANVPDIECFYNDFNAICEVTMLRNRQQWYHEGQPVMRHLRDFEDKHSDKSSYCLFIAPQVHRDTLNTFWQAVKYEYEGEKQKIIPLSIEDFVLILKVLLNIKQNNKHLNQGDIMRLYETIIMKSSEYRKASEWMKCIPTIITNWQDEMIGH